ncbi:unnamed protein product [Caenorhabditis sp. 36 PRJEB53466]|nr:unnamed protein product [Caenorhabditis sp. 36 PRJEB53466]
MEEVQVEPLIVNLSDNDDSLTAVPEDPAANPDVILLDDDDGDVENEATSNGAEEATTNGENRENGTDAKAEEQVEDEEEDNPFADDEDSDEDGGGVQVTIRKVEPIEKPAARQGKLDLDSTVMVNDKPIYDLDLAQMEDRPWRKPGADITDYFNYGFTEETWNLYCERQKKLRAEFSNNQTAANNALFSNIKISNPLANPVINTSSSVVKVLTDNGGRFKQPYNPPPTHQVPTNNEQVIRTVITGSSSTTTTIGGGMQPNPIMDFTKPPPGMSLPPPGMQPPAMLPTSAQEAPPGVDGISERPPGVETAPGVTSSMPSSGGLDLGLGLGLPPLGFNPNMPPPGMPPGMGPMGMLSTSMPPPGFGMPPPTFGHSRAGFGPGPIGMGGPTVPPRSLMSAGPFPQLSDDDEERRSSRRKRSRSRSPIRRDRDRDSRRRGERESDRTSSRRHRSRSTSRDRRRRRDDRDQEKRRERRDDDDRKKKSSRRGDDDDDRRESSSKKEKSSRSRAEDEDITGANTVEQDPVVE